VSENPLQPANADVPACGGAALDRSDRHHQLCAAVDGTPLTTLIDSASCMTRQGRCIVERALRSTAPRLTELLTLGDTASSACCDP
jgi:hypothetical protein